MEIMKAAYFLSPGKIELRKVEIPVPKSGEVQIQVKSAGICGTDHHIFMGELPGLVTDPLVLGHEFSGIITKLGDGVKKLKVGDHVAIDPNMFCKMCSFCRDAKKHFCKEWTTVGFKVNGGFEEFVCVKEDTCYLIPKEIPFEISAFFEPLACILHGMEKSEVKFGDTVVVQGVGGIGQIFSQCLALFGVSKIFLTDIIDSKLEMAKELVSSHNPSIEIITLNPRNLDDIGEEIRLLTEDGVGVDAFIDCAGLLETIPIGLKCVKKGGKILVFGVTKEGQKIEIEPYDILMKEIKIIGSFTQPYSNLKAAKVLKMLRLEKLIKKIRLEDIVEEGFLKMGKEGVFKIQVEF